jgi:hypothetical protein
VTATHTAPVAAAAGSAATGCCCFGRPQLVRLLVFLQDLRPFDTALQVVMAVIIHLELFVTIKAVRV